MSLQVYPVNSGIVDNIEKLKNVGIGVKNNLKQEFNHKVKDVSDNLKLSHSAVVKAFHEPRMMNVLEACGYSFATMFGAFSAASNLLHHGVFSTLIHVVEHEALHKLGHKVGHQDRAKALDKTLTKYPVLKKISGPALAGIMMFGYISGPTAKSLDGWDLTNVKKAFTGDYQIHDLLHSPEIVSVSAALLSGASMSLTSLAENSSTLAIGLACNAIIHSKHPKLVALGERIKESVDRFKSKGSPLQEVGHPSNQIDKDNAKEEEENSKNPHWFRKMSEEGQQKYLDQHHGSSYKVTAQIKVDHFRLGEKLMDVPLTSYPGKPGNTQVGSGVMFVARDTGRMLFVKRSAECDSPGTWCGLGGGVEVGETIDQGCKREVFEEAGFSSPFKLLPMYKDVQGDYVFHNHMAFIPKEFTPKLNHEHTDYMWTHQIPEPCHAGLLRAFEHYRDKV